MLYRAARRSILLDKSSVVGSVTLGEQREQHPFHLRESHIDALEVAESRVEEVRRRSLGSIVRRRVECGREAHSRYLARHRARDLRERK